MVAPLRGLYGRELVVLDRTPKVVIAQLAGQPAAAAPANDTYQYATLSRSGQLIGNLLLPEGEAPQPAALNRGEPLLAQPPTSGADLVPVLQKAVAQSGLFYESHQAEWVAGKMPIEQLLQEPQGQRSAPITLAQHGVTQHLPPTHPESGRAATVAAAETPTLMQTLFGTEDRSQAPAAQQPAAGLAQAVPEELRPIVQQQLDAVATQRLIWHGEAWPNQPVEWEIVRGDEQGNSSQPEDEASWRTTLRLDTPRLGHVDASLRLTAAGIHIAITTPSGATAEDLRAAAPELTTALDAAGVQVLSFQAKHDGSG